MVDRNAASFHKAPVDSRGCNFFVTCAKGTEGALRRELVGLRIHGPRGATGGVAFAGSFMDGMKVCLHSRVAMRVLLEVTAFNATDADQLYAGARAVDWTDFVGRGMTIAVHATTQDQPNLHHSGFAALKVKDGVVDMLRERNGRRPDVNPRDPDVAVVLHLRGNEARVFVDLAGEPLHRRGYRVAMVEAPLKESLAAAVLSLGGVPTDRPFVDRWVVRARWPSSMRSPRGAWRRVCDGISDSSAGRPPNSDGSGSRWSAPPTRRLAPTHPPPSWSAMSTRRPLPRPVATPKPPV
jgi:hypothetical protein